MTWEQRECAPRPFPQWYDGKLFIFDAGIRADLGWLVIIGVLNTVISAYYYLGVVRVMFLGDAEGEERVRISPSIGLSAGLATLGVFVFGVVPTPLLEAARDAAEVLGRQ